MSSVRQLFGCPLAWTLRYHAQLHPGTLLKVPDGDQLIGDIAHKLFKRLFEDLPSRDVFEETAAKVFDDLVASVGLPLLAPGRNVERNSVRRSIIESAKSFMQLLDDEQLIVESCESRKERAFGDGKFVGTIDILLRNLVGARVVVDHKWTR
ncbi:MAG: PD-(D/E)XK nuclease family protein, partial [Cyanobacteriota bacterium]